jgi:hypothetical protein
LRPAGLGLPGARIRFCFGVDAILGLAPGLGDALGAGFGCYLLALAYWAGAPRSVVLCMLANLGVGLLLGAVPLLGDLFDAGARPTCQQARHFDFPRGG